MVVPLLVMKKLPLYNTSCGREAMKGLDGSVADEGLRFLSEMEDDFDALSDWTVYLWDCVP